MQSLAALQPSFFVDGPDGRLRGGGDPVASGNRARQIMCTTPATRRESSMAPARCCSATRKPVRRLGMKPRAKIRAFANIGSEPAMMLTVRSM